MTYLVPDRKRISGRAFDHQGVDSLLLVAQELDISMARGSPYRLVCVLASHRLFNVIAPGCCPGKMVA